MLQDDGGVLGCDGVMQVCWGMLVLLMLSVLGCDVGSGVMCEW